MGRQGVGNQRLGADKVGEEFEVEAVCRPPPPLCAAAAHGPTAASHPPPGAPTHRLERHGAGSQTRNGHDNHKFEICPTHFAPAHPHFFHPQVRRLDPRIARLVLADEVMGGGRRVGSEWGWLQE